MSTARKSLGVIGLAAAAVLLQAGWALAGTAWVATDNFDSYPTGQLNGNDGWTDTGGNNYQIVAGAGVAGTQGVNQGGGSNQMNWTGYPWDWATLAVGDKAIARMDFQANGSGAFDDDRVGWVLASGASSSSYHFAVQLDNPDGGLQTYFRNLSGSRVYQTTLIANATLGASGSNWYREELRVEKLTSAPGPNGAQLVVNFWALDGSGNVVPASLKTASYGPFDTSGLRGFSGTVYPMFKNYSAQPGYADNAYFQITPEPATLALLAAGGVLALLRRRHR